MPERSTPKGPASRYLLASDNASGVHQEVLDRLAAANHGHALGYGSDPLTAEARAAFKAQLGDQVEAFFVLNGTAANVLALQGMLRSHEAVLCAEQAHLWMDECGAPEHALGCKLIAVASPKGKLSPGALEPLIVRDRGIVHRVQPRVISLAQVTERGTRYSVEELRALASFAHEHGLFIHMDGARIANAAAALGVGFRELTTDVGIDLLSFGGTKNGLMMADAVVVLNPELTAAYPFIQKQGMQLASKHRFVAAQFLAYFERDLWLRNASNANAMASYLAARITTFAQVELSEKVEANLVFARMPSAWIDSLQRVTPFLYWRHGETCEARLVTSFDTRREHIDAFVEHLQPLADREGL